MYELMAALATWRLARMVAKEKGPFEVFERIRDLAGRRAPVWVFDGLNCVACLSFWFGLALSIIQGGKPKLVSIRGIAYSGFAVALMRLLG